MSERDIAGALGYFRDLGFREILVAGRRGGASSPVAHPTSSHSTIADGSPASAATAVASPPGFADLATLAAAARACQLCRLASTRRTVVVGTGAADAELMFVGEAPGRDEDLQGEPFVGRAGQLLTKIIEAIDRRREDVYICNVLKCRPPENRNPAPDEVASCRPFLDAQIALVRPRVVVTLGLFAAQLVLANDAPISRIRGKFHRRDDLWVMPTYHPAYLLRSPDKKRDVWEDMKQVRAVLAGQLDPAAPSG